MAFAVEPTGAALGAVITDIDLRELSDDQFERLRQEIHEHEVVFLPGQHLDDDAHMAFASRLGPINIFALAGVLGQTEPKLTVIADDAESPPGADAWHTDVTWIPTPPDYAVLRGTLMPATGGDTMWASTTAAYEALSEPFRAFVDTLSVVHDNVDFLESVRTKMGSDPFDDMDVYRRLRAEYPPVVHPLVRTHPETGRRSLFLGGNFMSSIVGLEQPESDALLALFQRHITDPRFHVRWQWTEGDVVIWDERSTNHRALADHYPQKREVRRCEVGGSVPV